MAILNKNSGNTANKVVNCDDDDVPTIIPDGMSLRVPIALCDAGIARHIISDSGDVTPEQTYQARKQAIANRSRDPVDEGGSARQQSPSTSPTIDPDNAGYHARRIAKLENLWREGNAKSR